ncbi:MAG: zinc ABC transporter substrate-binding protein [Candidatus Micrarchaeota archaeon]|nr:zinc ABC transporter substrate-binding protein [Candidatus Micrarchaeota archaeon]MDE1848171.1 zinc ABC transporter substrate-binding protein [Candidatus Micrarchaeota archaeon]MDE1864641.1 zinc ABC transporter substrate-binding protein [Candidatus Micrarchaeota archaeon]
MTWQNKYRTIGLSALIIIMAAVIGLFLISSNPPPPNSPATAPSNHSPGRVIRIVAAENFWGSLAQQLGGAHVNVTSIVTDPNADPHEYESSTANARAIANASIVIVNGVGYDDWALRLISAGSVPNQTVLNVADLLAVPNGSNPHLWYDPTDVNKTVKQMYLDLVKIDPSDAGYYAQRYSSVTASLAQLDGQMAMIKQHFWGTKVASTESIFVYLANATGLDLISPPSFMDSVAEGGDPPTQSIIAFENQLEGKNVSVLVYNEQTLTPLTQQMKQIAAQHNITMVGVTETIQPSGMTFQAWMSAQLLQLQSALNTSTLVR